jgi:capsular polysaccharide biosynthesis protein
MRRGIEHFLRGRYEGHRVFRVLAVPVVLVAMAVTAVGLLQAPTYEATALVWVDTGSSAQGTGGKIQLIPLAPTPEARQTTILTMIDAIGSRRVAEEAIQRLGLQMDPDELSDNLHVEQVEGTQFIRLTYQGNDPVEATKIVSTVGKVVAEIASHRRSDVTAKVVEKAKVPESPVSPHPWRNGLHTLVVGLVLCAGTVVARRPGVGARVAGTLGERPTRQGVGLAGIPRRDRSIVERVKEKKLLLALGRRGKLTVVEAAMETSLSVEEAERMLYELALRGQLEMNVEHGRLVYSFWEHGA